MLGTSDTGFFQHDGYFRRLPVVAPAEVESPVYLRLDVEDQPGVLAQIASILATQGISIESVLQRAAGGRATLVVTTHSARRGQLDAALEQIADLAFVHGAPSVLPILPR